MDIPQIGFGTYQLNEKAYESCLNALKLGYRHFDTANLYKTEEALGKAIIDSGIDRKELFITTKISFNHLKKKKIKTGLRRSFERLNLEYIDLVLLHLPIHCKENWTLLEEEFLGDYKNKIRFIGVSNYSIANLESILEEAVVHPYVNQIEISPFFTRNKLIKYCNDKEIKVIAHSSLTKGKKLENEIICKIAAESNLSPAQVLLKWALEKKYPIIPRADNISFIKENIETLSKTLNKELIDVLDELNENFATHPRHIFKEDT